MDTEKQFDEKSNAEGNLRESAEAYKSIGKLFIRMRENAKRRNEMCMSHNFLSLTSERINNASET